MTWTGTTRWLLLAFAVVGYDLSPIDLVPDAVPLFGLLDDLGVTGIGTLVALWWWRSSRRERLALQTPSTEVQR